MTHHLKILISYILITSMSIVLLFNQFPIKSNAEIPSTQKVVAHTSTWSFPFNIGGSGKYYTIEDRGTIPDGSYLSPKFFYTLDGITFDEVLGTKLFTTIINKQLGIVVDTTTLDNLTSGFFDVIKKLDDVNHKYAQNGVYDSNDNFLGYATNDISGCYYVKDSTNRTPITNTQVNNVKNFYDYYQEQNKVYPDFITVYPCEPQFMFDNYKPGKLIPNQTDEYNEALRATIYNNINYCLQNNDYLWAFMLIPESDYSTEWNYLGFTNNSFNDIGGVLVLNDCHFIQASSGSHWNDFSDYYNLNKDNNTLNFNDIYYNDVPLTDNRFIYFSGYDSNNNQITTYKDGSLGDDPLNLTNVSKTYFYLGKHGNAYGGLKNFYMFLGKPYTIYKDSTTYNSIINQTYLPTTFYSSKYYDFDYNEDYSMTISKTIVDNSTTNNQTIYEDAADNYYDYVDNSVVDNSVINEYIEETTIIYYPDSDPEDPTDPDNPTDPEGPTDPESILDAILDALARFFKAIGKILATILAGLLEVVDSVLEAIASIAENFTGVTNFITALLSWLPEPVPQVLGAALSVAILFALLSFIRG